MKTTYKVGDLVQLKSGGPVMTVAEENSLGDGQLRCQWFSGKKLEFGWFLPATLKLPSEKEE